MKAKMCVICFSGSVGLNKYKLITMTFKPSMGTERPFQGWLCSFLQTRDILSPFSDQGLRKSKISRQACIWLLFGPLSHPFI